MKATFVILSVSERVADLNALVASIMRYPAFREFDLNLFFQDPDQRRREIEHAGRYAHIYTCPTKIGCHAARVELLRRLSYDAYVNLDDDMEVTEWTRYGPAIAKALEPGVGFVLTNWARTRPLLLRKVPAMAEKFVKQVLVYQGGGMCYGESVAKLMRELPPVVQTFDTAWPLTAYLEGYENYRYLGSLAVHRVCGTGGMASFMAATPPTLMYQEYVRLRRARRQDGTGRSLLIPLDRDVTERAREVHRKARARLLSEVGGA